MRTTIVAGLVLAGLGTAAAQEQRPRRVEFDAFGGYTAANIETWAENPAIENVSHVAAGVAVRGLLAVISTTLVGIEIGTQRVFSYEVRQQVTPTQVITEEHVVAGYHFLLYARFVDLPRFSWSAGAGFFGLGDVTAPGLVSDFTYTVLRRPRFSVPIGARLSMILNEPAVAASALGKIGISIPLDR